MISYVIKETDDFYSLAQFFSENGLETSIQKTTPEGIVKMWRLEHSESGELIAAATLQMRSDVHTLGDLAVREDFRGQGFGKLMQKLVFEEARKLGITELWGNAKVPAYYLKLVSAVIVAFALALPMLRESMARHHHRKGGAKHA